VWKCYALNRFFEVAKFTTLTLLSLLASCSTKFHQNSCTRRRIITCKWMDLL